MSLVPGLARDYWASVWRRLTVRLRSLVRCLRAGLRLAAKGAFTAISRARLGLGDSRFTLTPNE
ncbi:hypothetical protein PDE_06456 [Penicillium oxalicum 114-2]|uniref:Uncharacterized protein n=1 Tax=Penicillium oxalicum (strain 114-2 / CGMCC 5302) TaxID=933388 RepID=S7ZS21_PENO1|nr:hypothetical protein PDE_06456 [Penicillium oxalicum 114-2]